MTPDESAVSKDDGTVVAVESWIQENGWHKELRSKLDAVGHERPQWSEQSAASLSTVSVGVRQFQ